MNRPLVSICIPTYNGAKYIGDCLKSIARQSMDDYEVVLVDDNSADATVEIAREHAKDDPRIFVHRYEKNSGGGGAGNYNRCLHHAKGEWIKYLFQDDLLVPTSLEKLVTATGGGAQFVMSLLEYFSDSGDCGELLANHENLPTLAEVFGGSTCIKPAVFCRTLLNTWPNNFIGAPSASLIHADCFRKYGQFRNDYMTMADFEFWIRVASHEGVTLVPERLAQFRLHPASTTSVVTRDHHYRNALERLLTRYLMMQDAAYAAYRDPAISGRTPDQLNASFIKEARCTYWLAVDALKASNNPALMEQWEVFCSQHPGLQRTLNQELREKDGILPRIKGLLSRLRA